MLLCQDRSRYQINHLLVFLHRLERRPDRHLRLAKAYVSADQAIHDLMALHILFRGFDGGNLIVRLLEGEHFLKFSLPYRIRSILITFCRLARRIQFHQILRDIFDRSAHPCLGLVPFLAAKAVQLRLLGGIRRRIFLKGVHLRRQNVQTASARIFNFDIILHHPVYFDLFNSFVDTKSVIFVNHIISNGQLRKVLDLLTGILRFLPCFSPLFSENIRLCDKYKLLHRIFETTADISMDQHDLPGLQHAFRILAVKCRKFLFPQILRHTLRSCA